MVLFCQKHIPISYFYRLQFDQMVTCATDQHGKQESSTAPSRLSLPRILSTGVSKDQETTASKKIQFLQVNKNMLPMILEQKNGRFHAFFEVHY